MASILPKLDSRQEKTRQKINSQNLRYLLTIAGCVTFCVLLAASYVIL